MGSESGSYDRAIYKYNKNDKDGERWESYEGQQGLVKRRENGRLRWE